jgi:hypothetical protein
MHNPFKNPRKTGFISMLLALFGLGASGCIVPCMYGSPTADWTVRGKVLDEQGKGVPGLQVILGNRYDNSEGVIYDQNYWPLDTLTTGTDGTYQVDQGGFPINQLQVDIHDIDGEQNGGEYADVTLIVKDFEFEDGKGWYEGHAEINVPDIVVKKK